MSRWKDQRTELKQVYLWYHSLIHNNAKAVLNILVLALPKSALTIILKGYHNKTKINKGLF